MEKCERCGNRKAEWVFECEFAEPDHTESVCGHCVPTKAVRIRDFAFQSTEKCLKCDPPRATELEKLLSF